MLLAALPHVNVSPRQVAASGLCVTLLVCKLEPMNLKRLEATKKRATSRQKPPFLRCGCGAKCLVGARRASRSACGARSGDAFVRFRGGLQYFRTGHWNGEQVVGGLDLAEEDLAPNLFKSELGLRDVIVLDRCR